MCANISYLMMTLNRYLLVGKKHASWLVTIAKLEFKWVIRGSILFSALVNIGHGWEYQAIDNAQFSASYNYYTSQFNGLSTSNYPEANQKMPFFIYSIIYFMVNFGLFFILNTGIEIKIVRRIQKELKEKRERLANLTHSTRSTLFVDTAGIEFVEAHSPHADEDKKRKEEDTKKERKVLKMVVLNGVVNFILRAPDILFWMENTYVWSVLFNIQAELVF
jgi:hypothetical protein